MRFCNVKYTTILICIIFLLLTCYSVNKLQIFLIKIKDLNNEIEILRNEVILLKDPVLYQNGKRNATSIQRVRNSKRILVTGGAGFVGSHLVDALMAEGHDVIVIDNLSTGRRSNIDRWLDHPRFEFIHHDVVNPIWLEVDQIFHLASAASPPHYMKNPIKTIKTNTIGTINMLGLAKRNKARFLLASTSEVYGDPKEHPQPESYHGNVNTFGPRSCYDEAKRVAESLCYAYAEQAYVQVRVARIFNTYGPRMRLDDGRVVSNFIVQALSNHSITVYGDGQQTRSFQFISDLVRGLLRLMKSVVARPINLGNPDERKVKEFAQLVKSMIPGSNSDIVYRVGLEDDPNRRLPDIKLARHHLQWSPKIDIRSGLRATIDYFRNII